MSIINRMLNHFTPFKSDEELWHGSLDEKKKAEELQNSVKEKAVTSTAKINPKTSAKK